MTPELDLGKGGAFAYLRVLASPLVCSEIARLAPAQNKEAAFWALPSLPQAQAPRRSTHQARWPWPGSLVLSSSGPCWVT